jgi:hypothetical protein
MGPYGETMNFTFDFILLRQSFLGGGMTTAVISPFRRTAMVSPSETFASNSNRLLLNFVALTTIIIAPIKLCTETQTTCTC